MRTLAPALLVATMTLSACGWFGGGSSREVVGDAVPDSQTASVEAEANPLIPAQRSGILRGTFDEVNAYLGTPIDQVSALVIEPVPGGVILRATGITAYQGVHDLQLTPTSFDDLADENGVLTYRFEGVRPRRAVRGGPEQLRTVMVGRYLSDQKLKTTRIIRVEARRNSQSITRR